MKKRKEIETSVLDQCHFSVTLTDDTLYIENFHHCPEIVHLRHLYMLLCFVKSSGFRRRSGIGCLKMAGIDSLYSPPPDLGSQRVSHDKWIHVKKER